METVFMNVARNAGRFGIILVVILGLAVPEAALAHARMVRSSPKADELLQSPKKIELWFSELLDARFNSIVVFPAGELNARPRANMAREDARVDPHDRTHLSAAIKPLPPGVYMVEWRVLSLDGHSAPGRFTFRVLGPK
ncbi:MAG: copC domain protein [Pedosphaera sp.]|nr:copC domain protein [Pedosphaera sp.]